ncbi:MAG TPA: hypothetical protein VGE76_16310 [Opitutaceae bacterium]
MSGLSIPIDEVTPLIARLRDASQRQGIALVGARAAANLVRDHLFDLNDSRHKHGRNYYAQAARSVNTRAVAQGAAVNINQIGLRLRLLGGVVRPVNAKMLTIPDENAPEAHGVRAREFNDLDRQLVTNPRTGRLQWALVRRPSTAIRFVRRKRADGTLQTTVKPGELRDGKVLYWLVRKTTHKPDPSVLPTVGAMMGAAVAAIKLRFARLRQRITGQGDTTA